MPAPETQVIARRRIVRRRRQLAAAVFLMGFALVATAGIRLLAPVQGPVASTGSRPVALAITPAPGSTRATTTTENTIQSGTKPPTKTEVKTKTKTRTTKPRTAVRPTGLYSPAPGDSGRVGSGALRTYRVEVEIGISHGAPAFAAEVDATLANPESWTGQGRWSLERVNRDDVDFVIRLAAPATVDQVCAAAGLDTRGYASCRSGRFVMINLDRWMHAVPDYRGDVALYRQYVVNHEVGHQLGYGHQRCPRAGRLAPVMQQQTFGLDGCRPNGWPYRRGELVWGPAAA